MHVAHGYVADRHALNLRFHVVDESCSQTLQRYRWVSQFDKLLTCLKVQGGKAMAVMELKTRSNKSHGCIYIKLFTRVLNLQSNFGLHGKPFYGCSTFGLKNIRKVICGDLSDLKNTSWFVAELRKYAKCQITAKKKKKSNNQFQLRSHRAYAISARWFLQCSIAVLNTRVWFPILAGPSWFFFPAFSSPQSLKYRSAATEEVERETERDGRGEQSRSEIFMAP